MNPFEDMEEDKDFYDALVIGGGSRKGVVVLGYLHKKYPDIYKSIEYFSGTSAGSLLCVLFAAGYSPKDLFIHLDRDTDPFKTVDTRNLKTGLFNIDPIINKVEELLKAKGIVYFSDYEKIGKKVYVCATRITGVAGPVYFGPETPSIKVSDAVRASCSIPVIFKPVIINGETYVDGGVTDMIPVKPIRDAAFSVLAIRVRETEEVGELDPSNYSIIDIALRSILTLLHTNTDYILEKYKPDKLIDLVMDSSYLSQAFHTLESLFSYGKNY